MSVLALIPARAGSKGIPGKNLRTLGGKTLVRLAVECALEAGCYPVVTTDIPQYLELPPHDDLAGVVSIPRPRALASDTASMIDVVTHALGEIPPEYLADIVVLLQPTQPLRKPEHVTAAIALLQETGADSVVSVVPLPLTHSPDLVCWIRDYGNGRQALEPWPWTTDDGWSARSWSDRPTRRQDADVAYKPDGTVYAFLRSTVECHGTIYGYDCCPLIMDPADSCELDTEADWADLERRWQERHG